MSEQDLRENPFRDEIYNYLLDHGYVESLKEDYDYTSAMDVAKLCTFVQSTQPKEWEKLQRTYGEGATAALVRAVGAKISARGLLTVLKGNNQSETGNKEEYVEDNASGASIKMVCFKPSLKNMTDVAELAKKNIFSVRREFAYQDKEHSNRVDLAIFLNGLPLVMLELKKQTAGWSAAIQGQEQYQRNRSSEELCFTFDRRTLVYFAADEFAAYMTTKLEDGSTRFRPFNCGSDTGAENPTVPGKHCTYYLWEEVLRPEQLLDLIQYYIFFDEERRLIFPRYHQLRAVKRAEADVAQRGIGGRYLIWHSAGSGKTKTIAWLATKLINREEINTVIVVSDRKVIDDQLGDELAILYGKSVVKQVESGTELKGDLNAGSYILVTTLQKFRAILTAIQKHPERKYAFVIDEAHSSMAGKSMSKVAETLDTSSLQQAIIDEAAQEDHDDGQNNILKDAEFMKQTRNASYFAFTATPKKETVELFGTRTEEGKTYFDKYSMAQAIEEKYIINPLQCYTQYSVYYHIQAAQASSKNYNKVQALTSTLNYVSRDETVIKEKVKIMLDDFVNKRLDWMHGTAKAMIITPSRLHAYYYKKAVDAYIVANKCAFASIVAFSGKIKIGQEEYTESKLNGEYGHRDIKDVIATNDQLRIIVVADKLQTGYSEDKLSILYVDKKMGSAVKAVQTYSRINRIKRGKQTFILDFANDKAEIKTYFETFYDGDIFLPEANETSKECLEKKKVFLLGAGVFDAQDVAQLYALIQNNGKNAGAITASLNTMRDRVKVKGVKERKLFIAELRRFEKLYYYISTLLNSWDKELGKFAKVTTVLANTLQEQKLMEKFKPEDNVELVFHKAKMTVEEETIALAKRNLLVGTPEKPPRVAEPDPVDLTEIVRSFNAKYPLGQSELKKLVAQLAADASLQQTLKNSSESAARDVVQKKVDAFILDGIASEDDNKAEFYIELSNNEAKVAQYTDKVIAAIGGNLA